MTDIKRLFWDELTSAPQTSALYCWYYRLALHEYDVEECIDAIGEVSTADAQSIVEDFFASHLLSYTAPTEYFAKLTGALKASYEGTLSYVPSLGESYYMRFVDDPALLRSLASATPLLAPYFASPLYIGISGNLQQRLLQHMKAIKPPEGMRSRVSAESADFEPSISQFGDRVRERRMVPERLFVYYTAVDAKTVNALEYLLNRITFPILGER